MKLLVRAADFGMTDGITDGCMKAIREGVLKDVELFTNGPAGKRAAELVREYKDVSIGIAMNLSSGVPASDPKDIPSLVDENENFKSSVYRKSTGDRESDYDEIYHEMEEQLKRFMEWIGKKPLYIQGHSFTSKNYEKAMDAIAEKYGIVRDWCEGCGVEFGDRWYEKTKDYSLDKQAHADVLGYILEDRGHMLEKEYAMLSFHLGYCDGELMKMSTFSVVRGVETSALCSPEFKKWVKDNNIELINMETLMEERYHKADYNTKRLVPSN